jgi:hypothetical protein
MCYTKATNVGKNIPGKNIPQKISPEKISYSIGKNIPILHGGQNIPGKNIQDYCKKYPYVIATE